MLYTYLQARGYQVSVGKIGKLECDFITRKANDHAYMQVAFSIAERSVGGAGIPAFLTVQIGRASCRERV